MFWFNLSSHRALAVSVRKKWGPKSGPLCMSKTRKVRSCVNFECERPNPKSGSLNYFAVFGYNIEKGTKIRSKKSGVLPQGLTFFLDLTFRFFYIHRARLLGYCSYTHTHTHAHTHTHTHTYTRTHARTHTHICTQADRHRKKRNETDRNITKQTES